MDPSIEIAVINGLKNSLIKSEWWDYVQESTRTRLEFIIDNIASLGIPFRDTILAFFRFTHQSRLLKGIAIKSTKPSALNRTMSEECFQSSLPAVKAALDLNEWESPNDADVQACLTLCNQIDALEKINMLKPIKDEFNTTTTVRKRPPTTFSTEKIRWG